MASLNTVETKVAYLIQMIAIQLYKASKEIGFTVGDNKPFCQVPADHCVRNPQTVPTTFDSTSCELTPFSPQLH
jgi:hypothetical protein